MKHIKTINETAIFEKKLVLLQYSFVQSFTSNASALHPLLTLAFLELFRRPDEQARESVGHEKQSLGDLNLIHTVRPSLGPSVSHPRRPCQPSTRWPLVRRTEGEVVRVEGWGGAAAGKCCEIAAFSGRAKTPVKGEMGKYEAFESLASPTSCFPPSSIPPTK